MTLTKAEFAAATVMALRRATATPEQLKGPPPTLAELNIDVSQSTTEEIASVEGIVRQTWEQPRH